MLKEVFYLIVSGSFDRESVRFEEYPTEKEIFEEIKSKKGVSARVEKRFVLEE